MRQNRGQAPDFDLPEDPCLPQYPLINDFGEEHNFSLYEIKDGSLLEVEKVSLQQRLNQFQHEVSPLKPTSPIPCSSSLPPCA